MNDDWQVPSYKTTEFQEKKTKYAVIIPVINEGQRIITQLQRMREVLPLADAFIVDGGSTDDSLEHDYLKSTGLRALLLKTGPGKLSAQLRIGLAHALNEGYEGVILIDGNNKDNPDAIPLFIEALDQGYDHIQGSRFIQGGRKLNNPLLRVIGIKILHAPLLSIASGFRYTDTTNGFRAYSRKLLSDPAVQPFRDIFSAYELHYYLAVKAGKLGLKIKEVPVEREYPIGKVPTKISGIRGNLLILQTLFRACTTYFDPKPKEVSGTYDDSE